MNGRHFDSTENAELRAKIDEAKRRLPLPQLLARLVLGECAKESAHCPFHDDEHESFSVFQSKDGKGWQWKCHASCGYGDEIALLVKRFCISRREAIKRYLDVAGFPTKAPPKSREYRKSRAFPEYPKSPVYLKSPVSPVSPVSNGQGLGKKLEKELKDLATRNAYTERSTARKRRWRLLRDLRAVQERIARKLTTVELVQVFDEWYPLSLPFLDPAKTRDDYLAAFLAELGKVRVPTDEGATLNKALEAVSKLRADELPLIPGIPDAPASWRRLTALHRELSRLSANGTHFLSYRDAAKVCNGLSHQEAHTITGALVRLGVIEIIRKGKAGVNSRKAAEFRYLLPRDECSADEGDEIPV
jgi:hypothetical protein